MRSPMRWIHASGLLLLVACGGDDTPGSGAAAGSGKRPEVEPTSSDGAGYETVVVDNGGTLRGMVRSGGPAPTARTVAITEDNEVCGNERQIQTVDIGASGGLANGVVSIVDITRGIAMEDPTPPPELDQRDCGFHPQVLLVPVDVPVHILNSDPITHNVHTVAFDNRPVNRSQPREVPKIEVSFAVAEKVKVKCDIHDWMTAWIVVVDHPYHAVTSADGAFVIENLPPGTYTVEAWHEAFGAVSQTVTIEAGEVRDLAVEIPS